MNNTVKIILFILAGLMVVCLAGLLLAGPVVKSIIQKNTMSIGIGADNAQAIAGQMVQFEAPADFGEPYAFQMLGYSLITFTGSDGHSHIYFMQVPEDSGLTEEELLSQVQKMSGSPIGTEFDNAQPMDVVIMGQTVTMLIIDGINSANQPYRQAVGIFAGQDGPILVVFERPLDLWDETELLDFLSSIRQNS